MPEPETNIDWSGQITQIRRNFEQSLRTGETIDGLDRWLEQIPEVYHKVLRDELDRCRTSHCSSSVDMRLSVSDVALESLMPETFELAAIAGEADPTEEFSLSDLDNTAAITKCKTFAGLSEAARAALKSRLMHRDFPTGSALLTQGAPASGLYLLLSGSVDIVDTQTGQRIDADGAGSVMGEMSLLTEQPCSASVTATSDVVALTLSAGDYHEIKGAHPELEIALSQLVSDRLGCRNHDALCGKAIGDYRLIRCINRGGMGVVYEAVHRQTGASVALKMLRHRFIYDDSMQERFDQEAQLLARLRHENVVSYQENFLAFRTRFLVLDLCDGADLFLFLRKHGPFDEATTRAIVGQIAKGLCYAHQSGVVHRDLKPGNVLVDREGIVKLTDFGLSKLLESEVSTVKAVGTPAYMPPEQFRSENVGPPSDWYALGCMACEMLTGQILFRDADWRVVYEKKLLRKPTAKWPPIEVSDEFREFISATLAPQPEDRNVNMDAVMSWADVKPVHAVQQTA